MKYGAVTFEGIAFYSDVSKILSETKILRKDVRHSYVKGRTENVVGRGTVAIYET